MADVLVVWEDKTCNLCSVTDLLPPIVIGATAAWKYDPLWTGKICSIEDSDNILVEWFTTCEKNIVSEADLMITNASNEVVWRYDKSWRGKIQTFSQSGRSVIWG